MYDGSKPGIMLYRCGGATNVGSPLVRQKETLNAQTCLNAVVNLSLVDDAVRLLLTSLAGETQAVYIRNWEMWTRFCSARKISPCVDTSKRNWDVDILTFLTWDHTVVKNGGGTLGTRFGAIRFLHLLEGKGDFDGKAFRIRALINAVKRKKCVNQRLPLNPEMLERWKSKLNLRTPAWSEMWAGLMIGCIS